MEFEARHSPQLIEVRMTGRLEFTDHDSLPDIVALLDRPGLEQFMLDLSDLAFIDSAGLGMLLILQEEAEQRNAKLVVRGPRDDVRRSLDLARIGDILTIEY
ncbi:STAS domain-containing protein [Azospirillum canadense]|uniref:STAS domain-containing protein n=1 Tax=Azospirillum canadense TaxID=403962 RepID=UPI0022262543|nr:STAS domain-containing protein [Azospirillum canadense]MCW2238005.1 stage II sporulation protein AA (anti-sigma F factor antagonist) [Azospirillum canadense]